MRPARTQAEEKPRLIRGDAVALAERLTHVFETHGAGPFSLRVEVRPVESSFRFLGYEFAPSFGGARLLANAPTGVADAMGIELINEFSEAATPQQLLQVCRRLRGFMAAYELAGDVREVSAQVVELMRGELAYRREIGTA